MRKVVTSTILWQLGKLHLMRKVVWPPKTKFYFQWKTDSPPRPRPPLMLPRPPKSALRVAKDTLIGFPLKSLPVKEYRNQKVIRSGAEAKNKSALESQNGWRIEHDTRKMETFVVMSFKVQSSCDQLEFKYVTFQTTPLLLCSVWSTLACFNQK